MASATEIPRFTPEQYLALERKADFKSEYHNGFIWAMAGASSEHNLIAGNLHGEIRTQLKGRPCRVYISDMRLRVSPTGLYTYPDVMAVCGEPRFLDDEADTLLNPAMIAEVLSPTTEAYDRGDKFARFRQLSSLQEYVLIAQDKVLVERYTRQGDQWLLTEFKSLDDALPLTSIGCEIALREIYALIEFRTEKGRAFDMVPSSTESHGMPDSTISIRRCMARAAGKALTMSGRPPLRNSSTRRLRHGISVVIVDVVTARSANLHRELFEILEVKNRRAFWESTTGQ